MPQVSPSNITALPPAPSITDPSNFDAKAEAILNAWPTNISETNALGTNVYNNAVDAYSSAVDAANSAEAAQASANTAQAFSTATAWVSGYTYIVGDTRYSLLDLQVYRRTTPGSGTVDPKLDYANWTLAVKYTSLHAISLFYSTSF